MLTVTSLIFSEMLFEYLTSYWKTVLQIGEFFLPEYRFKHSSKPEKKKENWKKGKHIYFLNLDPAEL